MRVLIIEDEKITANDLKNCIQEIRPNYEVVNILASVQTSITFLKTKPTIDLIFSDIQLTDGLSFEIFKKISIEIPVIFCTAYDEYALNAFDANGIAYVLKPFSAETIKPAIEKFEKWTAPNVNNISKLMEYIEVSRHLKTNASILIYQGEKIIPINFDNIAMLYLKHGVVKLLTFDRQTYISSKTLEELDNMKFPDLFRANRQHIIHRKAIKSAAKYFNRKLVIHLNFSFPEKIIISKEKAPIFLNWLALK